MTNFETSVKVNDIFSKYIFAVDPEFKLPEKLAEAGPSEAAVPMECSDMLMASGSAVLLSTGIWFSETMYMYVYIPLGHSSLYSRVILHAVGRLVHVRHL